MTILQGTMQDGTVIPVQVDSQGRLVAEGLQGVPGPVGPAGGSFVLPANPRLGDLLGWTDAGLAWVAGAPEDTSLSAAITKAEMNAVSIPFGHAVIKMGSTAISTYDPAANTTANVRSEQDAFDGSTSTSAWFEYGGGVGLANVDCLFVEFDHEVQINSLRIYGSNSWHDSNLGIRTYRADKSNNGLHWIPKSGQNMWTSVGNTGPVQYLGISSTGGGGTYEMRLNALEINGTVITPTAQVETPSLKVLTLAGPNNLDGFASGDVVTEMTAAGTVGDATGTVAAVDPAGPTITLSTSTGTWTVGSKVKSPVKIVAAHASH